jgi:putative Mg2+ transporter-C (MgtC) family protein
VGGISHYGEYVFVHLSYLDFLARLGLALALGGAIGLERELNAQPAGFRTHALVCIGGALFTAAGTQIIGSDHARVAVAVASGIGFLGAGAILRDGQRIRGLTTAASLWATAAVGLADGVGLYAVAATFAAVIVIVLTLLKSFERGLFPRVRGRRLRVVVPEGVALAASVNAVSGILRDVTVNQVVSGDAGEQVLALRCALDPEANLAGLADRLLDLPQVSGVEILR